MTLTLASIETVLGTAPPIFREMLPYLWRELWMRPDQDPLWDQDWLVRLMLGGRGAGKTRSAAEAIREAATTGVVKPGQGVGLVGRTYDEAVNIMVQGPSGVLNVGHPSQRPSFVKATGELKWPNGVTGLVLSAEAPSSLRGHQFRIVWCDEPAAWSRLESVGDQNPWRVLQMAVREQGEGSARILATTTPRATMWMRRLANLPTTLMTAVPTSINIANLDARQVAGWYAEFAGSRWADQELEAQILDETEGAWFRREWFQSGRRDPHPVRDTPAVWVNEMPRQLVVGVDPQGGGESMCGIIVCAETVDGELQVWDDMSIHGSPAEWADQVILCCEKWHTREVALEKEYGNKMGRDLLLRSPGGEHLNIHLVSSGGQGKALRAEPVAARFQKKQARMRGGFRDLEEQCCVASGTPVATRRGAVAIEDVLVGDEVWTRQGWRPVIRTWDNGHKTNLVTLEAGGCAVTVTADHKMATPAGWVQAGDIKIGDQLTCLAGTEPTTTWPTSNASQPATTYASTSSALLTAPRPEPASVPRTASTGPSASPETSPALCAAPSSPAPEPSSAQPHAPRRTDTAGPMFLARVTAASTAPTARVHDLSVAEVHEYFAGGICASNCIWTEEDKTSPDRMDAMVHAMRHLDPSLAGPAIPEPGWSAHSELGPNRWRIT